MATLNGNLGGFKDNKMNCGAGKLISAEHLLLIHGDDCAFCVCSRSFSYTYQIRYYIDNFHSVRKYDFFELLFNGDVNYFGI